MSAITTEPAVWTEDEPLDRRSIVPEASCGTCMIQKTSGEVRMVNSVGLLGEDIAEGGLPACCPPPLGRVIVEV